MWEKEEGGRGKAVSWFQVLLYRDIKKTSGQKQEEGNGADELKEMAIKNQGDTS